MWSKKRYSAGRYAFDNMTLIFLYKPINYGVACLLYGVACSNTMIIADANQAIYPHLLYIINVLY